MTGNVTLLPVSDTARDTLEASPAHLDPAQWHQAVGVARQACARIFRDGGSPADALSAFHVKVSTCDGLDWSKAVTRVAETLCAVPRHRRAA